MLTEKDFDDAYGPLVHKWKQRIGDDHVRELMADIAPAVQGLLRKTIGNMHAAGVPTTHTDHIAHGITTFDAWRTKHGH